MTYTPIRPDQDAATAQRTDREVKRERVLEILDTVGRDALMLTSTSALTWYLDGSRVHISLAGDPVAAVIIDREGDHLVSFANEIDRLVAEELPAGLQLHQVPWHGSIHDASQWYGLSDALLDERSVERELRDARRSLLPHETARYSTLSREAAEAMTDVLLEATPGTTELQVAATLSERVVALGAEPLVLLCSGSDRAAFRHPLPTHAPLGRRAMAVLCARRNGMVTNLTRWIRFGVGSRAETDAEARIMAVEAEIFAATEPGASLKQIFSRIMTAYGHHGFGPEEWSKHHQGGPAGYAGRDPRATASTDDKVAGNQAFTWNPTAPGVKVEDTVLLTDDGLSVLTVDKRWPTTNVEGLERPVTLQL